MGNGGGNGGGVESGGYTPGFTADLGGGKGMTTGGTDAFGQSTHGGIVDASTGMAADTGGMPVGDGAGGGGWVGGLSKTQQSMAQFTGASLASGNIPGAMLGIVGLALSGAGTGDVSTMGGGPSGDPGQMQAHRDFTGATGMTAPGAAKKPGVDKPAEPVQPERTRRATTKTLFTSPLGIPGEPPVKRKTLMAKNLREDLG